MIQAAQDSQVPQVHAVTPGCKDLLGHKVTLVSRVFKVQLVCRELQAPKVTLEFRVLKDPPVHKECKVFRV